MNILISILKIAWLGFWLGLMTLIVIIPIFISALFVSTGNFVFWMSRIWTWVILKLTGIKTRIRGIENIDKGRNYIIIANHQSHFDILALISTLGIQLRWVAKKELLKVPFFGQGLYLARAIFVDRTNKRRAIESIRDGIKGLPKGVSIVFFAEGTRSPDGKFRPFKKGGFMAAIETGTPILPVTVNGSRDVLPKGSVVYHRECMEVVVGKSIDSRSFTKKEINDLISLTRDIIISNFKA